MLSYVPSTTDMLDTSSSRSLQIRLTLASGGDSYHVILSDTLV